MTRLSIDRRLSVERSGKQDDRTDEWVKALLDSCHPYQRAFVEDPARRVVALTPGRCGKTTAIKARVLLQMLRTPRARCLFVAATRPAAEKLLWGPVKDVVNRLGIPARFNETKLQLTFLHNKSVLDVAGLDNKHEADKQRGIPRHLVCIDEGASYPSALLANFIDRVIGPRLGDYDGAICLTGTPGHILSGLFYDVSRPGSPDSRRYDERHKPEFADWIGWSLHTWNLPQAAEHVPTIANVWKNALLEKKRQGWSDDNPIWMREYLGLWAADDTENVFRYRPHDEDGNEFNQWDPDRSKVTGFADLPSGDWSYVYGLDMGHSDPFAVVVLAHNSQTNELRHVYEFEEQGLHVRDIAKLLVGSRWTDAIARGDDPGEPQGLIGVTGWPFAIVADATNLGGAIIEELRQVYGIPVEKAEQKHKHDSVELTNGDLVDGRLRILKGSKLEAQILNLQWAVDDIGRLKEQKGVPNHLTDALIYARRKAAHLTGVPMPPPEPSGEPSPRPAPDPLGSYSDEPTYFEFTEFEYGDDDW